jgi:hypothetical protein
MVLVKGDMEPPSCSDSLFDTARALRTVAPGDHSEAAQSLRP